MDKVLLSLATFASGMEREKARQRTYSKSRNLSRERWRGSSTLAPSGSEMTAWPEAEAVRQAFLVDLRRRGVFCEPPIAERG